MNNAKQNRATSILGRPANETDLATGLFFFAPIGKELIRRATRARTNVIDLLRWYAGLLQYRAIETAQIEIRSTISMLDTRLGDLSPSFDQGTRNVLLNLVAARSRSPAPRPLRSHRAKYRVDCLKAEPSLTRCPPRFHASRHEPPPRSLPQERQIESARNRQ